MKLHVVHAPRKPTLAQIRQAVALFRSDLAPRSVRRANARNWLIANEQLGDRHLYRSNTPAKWGHNVRGTR